MKNILILSETKPSPRGRAEEMAFSYLSKFILEKKYNLTYIYIKIKNINKNKENKNYDFLNKNNFNFKKKIFNLKKKIIKNIINTIDFSKKVVIKKIKNNNLILYDNIIAIGHTAFFLSNYFRFNKRLFIMGDSVGERLYLDSKLNFLNNFNILNIFNIIYSYLVFIFERFYWRCKISFKKTKVGIFGTYSSKRFGAYFGNQNVIDLRPPMPKRVKFLKKYNKNYTSVVFGGSLGGTLGKNTLNNFISIVEKLPGKNFKFFLVGHDIEKYITRDQLKKYKNLYIYNVVHNFEYFLSSKDIFVLPTDYYVGVRVRLCSSLLSGNYCIVTQNSIKNMPELLNCSAVKVIENQIDKFIGEIREYRNFNIKKKILITKAGQNFFDNNYSYIKSSESFIM
jgi:hypothetical protein